MRAKGHASVEERQARREHRLTGWQYVGPGVYRRGANRIELRPAGWHFDGSHFRCVDDAMRAADSRDLDGDELACIVKEARELRRAEFPYPTIIKILSARHGCTPATARNAIARIKRTH